MQEIPVDIQSTYFLITMILGIAVGFLFDANRTCRYFWRPRRHVGVVLDLIFWLVVTVVVYAGLLLANWGEVRFYVFVGMALGLAFYYLTVSRFVLLLMRRFLSLGIDVANALYRIVRGAVSWFIGLARIPLWPLIFLGRLLRGYFAKTGPALNRAGSKVNKKVRKCVNIFSKRKS